jgi:hypothetical protein
MHAACQVAASGLVGIKLVELYDLHRGGLRLALLDLGRSRHLRLGIGRPSIRRLGWRFVSQACAGWCY